MSDIRPGDLVVCVNAGPVSYKHKGETILAFGFGLVRGRAYEVETTFHDEGQFLLRLVGDDDFDPMSRSAGRLATRFRKLLPADPEFIEQLAATKRPVRAEEVM